jgi:hypothetical protein
MPMKLLSRLTDVFLRTWYLGFTSFGGPVVHFQIFHRLFVQGSNPWINEQTVRIVDRHIFLLFLALIAVTMFTLMSCKRY